MPPTGASSAARRKSTDTLRHETAEELDEPRDETSQYTGPPSKDSDIIPGQSLCLADEFRWVKYEENKGD
jgi:hypothetical protein